MTKLTTKPYRGQALAHRIWRRGVYPLSRLEACLFFGTLVNIVRTVALISAVISVGSFFAQGAYVRVLVSSAGLLAAIVTLADLAFQFDASARVHGDLYRRFKSLQADIARYADDAPSHLTEWDARAKEIRVDEPPVYWSIYASCWNSRLSKESAPARNMFGRFHLGKARSENISLCISGQAISRQKHNLNRYVRPELP